MIMPETIKLKILELRGLPVQILIDIVHKNGGNIRAGTSLRREIFKLHQYPEEAESDGGDESV